MKAVLDEFGFAIGQMGLNRDEYLDLTPFEFEAIHEKWLQMKKQEVENDLYNRLFAARMQVFKTLCPPKGKQIKITDLWFLPGEKEEMKKAKKKTRSSRDRFEEMKKRFRN